MSKKLLIGAGAVLLAGLLVAAVGAWLVFGANTPDFEDTRGVKIPPGSDLAAVADSLDAAGLLDGRSSFELVANLTGWGDQVKPGHYAFDAGASNYDLLDTIRKGLQTPVRVTIPPGSRPEVVAAVVGRDLYLDADSFLAALRDPKLAADLGTDTLHLPAFMLPETYSIYWTADAESVVRKIKSAFDDFYAQHHAPGGIVDLLNLDQGDVATVASLVEWETYVVDEKPRVAGVYLNRLRRGWRLDADPTVQFALLEIEGQKRRLFLRDYKIDHPYNTYTFTGLPPGPVTNPSPSSVRAVLNAEQHDYMFFVAKGDGTGEHTFTRTNAEHVRAARRYYEAMRQRRAAQVEDDGSS